MTPRNTARTPEAHLQAEQLETRDTPAVVGALDPTFAAADAVTGITYHASAVQADGKVVAVGTDGTDIVVARYTADGALDPTFNVTGVRVMDGGGTEDRANALAIQGDGKIVVVGSNGADAVVARFRTDGSLDTGFNGTGLQVLDFGGEADTANAVAIQNDQRIVVTGTDGMDVAVARLNYADGSLDTSFNTIGTKLLDLGGETDSANAVAIQGNGSILLAGTTGTDFAFTRLTSAGELDTSFDADGLRLIDGGGGTDSITALTLQSDGKILAAGTNGADVVLMRLVGANGENDNSFGSMGKVTLDFNGVDSVKALAIQADNKLVVAGGNGNGDAVVARLKADGSLDMAFGNQGTAVLDLGGNEAAVGIATATGGRLVVVGNSDGNGQILRLVGSSSIPTSVSASGTPDGTAQVFTPSADGTSLVNTTSVAPFGGFVGNVRTATGDVDGDGIDDLVTITGPGTRIGLAVVSGKDNRTILVGPMSPFAGSESFTGGGNVAVGDLDNDGRDEILVTPDNGGGGRVVVMSLLPDGLKVRADFYGIQDLEFRGGARAAIGDVNGDGVADLAVAAGQGGGPRVALFDGADLLGGQRKLVSDFYAYPGADAARLRNGAFVTIGDVNGDGFGDLIFGGGPGGAPRIFALNGETVVNEPMEFAQATPLANFYAGNAETDRGGIRVAIVDLDGDANADLVASSGSGITARVQVFAGNSIQPGSDPVPVQSFDPFNTGKPIKDGVFVG